MFIIFGSTTLKSRVGNVAPLVGQCPDCGGTLYFTKFHRYFTLFFIPLFPIDSPKTSYRCSGCSNCYAVNKNPRTTDIDWNSFLKNLAEEQRTAKVEVVHNAVPIVDVDQETRAAIKSMGRTDAISFCREKYDLSIKDAKALIFSVVSYN